MLIVIEFSFTHCSEYQWPFTVGIAKRASPHMEGLSAIAAVEANNDCLVILTLKLKVEYTYAII